MEIKEKYLNPNEPGSLSSLNTFLKSHKNLDKKKVETNLNQLPSYTQHRAIKKKFRRNRVLVGGIDEIWQADLLDLRKFQNHNYGNKYALTNIDIFSKRGWVKVIKSKTAQNTCNAFKSIFKDGRQPKKIHVDGGNEFKGECKKYLEGLGIKIYQTNSKLKASIVERFNRTIMSRISRYFTYSKSLKKARMKYLNWTNHIEDVVDSYNNTYHNSIKEKPINVTEKNENKIFKNLYGMIFCLVRQLVRQYRIISII